MAVLSGGGTATSPYVSYTHQDLVLHAHAFYTLQRGKRLYSPTAPSGPTDDAWFEFEADLFPPLMLLPKTWQRYQYTVEDVHNTYDKLDASYVWQLALVLLCGTFEPEAASAGVRPTFQSLFTFLFISRKAVFDIFLESQAAYLSKRIGSSLCHERPDHKPLLPRVTVDPVLFARCSHMVPPVRPGFRRLTSYDHLVAFQDITLVPVEYDHDHDLVYMVRVVTQALYDTLPAPPRLCMVTLPVLVNTHTQPETLYVLLDEACFFASSQPVPPSAVKKRAPAPKKATTPLKKRKT